MSELVNVLSLDNPEINLPMERNSFYKEQIEVFKSNGKPTKAVEIVNIFLFNEAGQLIIQKRSSSKSHNPNLMDKTVGGHVVYGDSPNFTVMLETVQELQVPSIVLNNDEDFIKTYNLLKNYTSTTAIVKHFKTETIFLKKVINGEDITIANKSHLYIGIYDGSVRNVDKEAKGVLFYYIHELEEELIEYPNNFTYDLRYYFERYGTYISNFEKEFYHKS